MGVDIATFFFCREKDALFSWSEEHNDFTNLVKFTDTVKLSLFENEIVESAHTKAVDVIKTLMKVIKRAEKLGMDKEQVAEVIKLLIKERIPNQYSQGSCHYKLDRIGCISHYDIGINVSLHGSGTQRLSHIFHMLPDGQCLRGVPVSSFQAGP